MCHVELVADNANERYLHPVFCNAKKQLCDSLMITFYYLTFQHHKMLQKIFDVEKALSIRYGVHDEKKIGNVRSKVKAFDVQCNRRGRVENFKEYSVSIHYHLVFIA